MYRLEGQASGHKAQAVWVESDQSCLTSFTTFQPMMQNLEI